MSDEGKRPKKQIGIGKDRFETFLDRHFEPRFFALRYIVFIPVIFSFIGSVMMFIIGAHDCIEAFYKLIGFHNNDVLIYLIKSVDAFLFGLVLLIFSFGMYDLFISKIDIDHSQDIRPDWMQFTDLGELKKYLAEVILIILIIMFFELVIGHLHEFEGVWSFLVIPIGALLIALSIGLFKKFTQHV